MRIKSELKRNIQFYLFALLIGLLTACQQDHTAGIDFHISTAQSNFDDSNRSKNPVFLNQENLDLGFYRGQVWIKIELEKSPQKEPVILLCNDLINRNYRFYKWNESKHAYEPVYKNVDTAYYDHRSTNFSKPNFLLELNENEPVNYLISTTSDGRILQASPRILSQKEFKTIENQTLIFDSIFYGVIFIILLINFFYSRLVRNDIYLYYCTYIIFGCLMYLFVEGRLYGYGLSHHFIDHLMFISIRLWILTSILFCTRFLETKFTNPKFYRFVKIALIVTLSIPTIYQFVFYKTSIQHLHMLENLLGFVWIIFALTIVSIAFKKRRQKSTYYLIAFSLFIVFVTLGLIDSHTTILPGDPFSYFKIGTIFEFIGFTYFIAILVKKKLIVNQNLEIELRQKQLEINQINSKNARQVDYISIFKLVENSLNNDDDWETFKRKLGDLNPNFLNNLLSEHPNLSKSETRLLILIKVGYSQKEIANILNIAPDSVKKARSRARKKLQLSENEKLNTYLNKL